MKGKGNHLPYLISLVLLILFLIRPCPISTLLDQNIGSVSIYASSINQHVSQSQNIDHNYDFSIRIAYKGIFGIINYADLPMGIIMEENDTTIRGGTYGGGFLTSMTEPPYVERVSSWTNQLGWAQLANGTTWQTGGFGWGWTNYSIWGGWSGSAWQFFNKSIHLRILKWIIIGNITISFRGRPEIRFGPSLYINVTGIATSTDSGWVYNATASSSFPENQIDLDVEAHVMTIYVSYPSPPLPAFLIPLIVGGIFAILAVIGVSLWMILRYKKKEELFFERVLS